MSNDDESLWGCYHFRVHHERGVVSLFVPGRSVEHARRRIWWFPNAELVRAVVVPRAQAPRSVFVTAWTFLRSVFGDRTP
jgi:hypothetical protein